MKGTTIKRCACRDPETHKQLGARCPKLKGKSHGAWWARYDAPPSADGKRRRAAIGPFRTKKLADDALATALAKIGYDGQASDHTLKVGPYLSGWVTAKTDIKKSTLTSYHEAVNLYLMPGLGHLRLADLGDHHAAELYAEMQRLSEELPAGEKPTEMRRRLQAARATDGRSRRPLSPARIRRVHAVLSSALGHAVRTKKLTRNPVEYVSLPKCPRRRRPLVWTPQRVARWLEIGKAPGPVMVWTPEQAGAFLDFIAGERLYALFHLVAFRGLRRAEVAGLPWAEIDLDAGTITIRETRPDDEVDPEDPKSDAGTRTIPLDAQTAAVLRAWKAQQATERLALGPGWPDTGLVFTHADGTPLRPDWISRRFAMLIGKYQTIRLRLGEGRTAAQLARRHAVSEEAAALTAGVLLPPVRFHDLRHGAATLSLAARVDMKVISVTLGHARPSFTADVYGAVLPELEQAAAEATAAVVPRRFGLTLDSPSATSAPAQVVDLSKSAGQSGGSGI
ncbi:MAG TPA: tyrosine-type recombinase/integrase [Streptosporangiaceae bacterium]